jgi:hypothetical protein
MEMNVLQAVEELQILKDKISALETAIFQLDSRKEHSHEVRLLIDIKDELVKEKEMLQHRLEITPLVTTRRAEITK